MATPTTGTYDAVSGTYTPTSDAGVQAALSWGISEAVINAHKDELTYVYSLFKDGNITKAVEELFKTTYYQTTSKTVAARERLRLEQNPVYLKELEKFKLASRKRLTATGVTIDEATFNTLAEQAYNQGLDDNQFDQSIINTGKITGFSGNILGDTSQLKNFANAFGVSNLLNEDYWSGKSSALFAGTITTQDIEEEIKKLSASAFPAYAEGIMNGISLDVQASNIKQTVATFLELDPNALSYQDDIVRKMLQYVDPTTGKPAQMPQWLAEQTVKKDPRWGKTKNAEGTIDSLIRTVGQDWGILY
jgi:hypothetical protein